MPARYIAVRIVLVLLALGVCAVTLICYGFYSTLTHSDAYKSSVAIASSNREVQELLGSNIRPQIPALGHIESFDDAEFAEWSVPLSGAKGRGHLYGTANRVNGVWDYSRLIFESANGDRRVNLAPVRQLSLLPVPSKHVYLLPLGLVEGERLDWAPAYYRAKLGIDVALLPPVPLISTLINERRDQLNASKCVEEFLQQKYPQLAKDPAALIIVVTSKDMFIEGLNWRFAENMRWEGRWGVVSSARLHPLALLEKMNPEWLNSRLQKLLTKNIAILYFGLPMSSDYTSLLSGGVLSGREIDRMGGEIIGSEGRWDPFFDLGAPSVSIYETQGQETLWNRGDADTALPDPATQVFSASLEVGIIVQRKADFVFPDDPALQFTRVYRNQDDRSRSFGIGASHSFDMFLGGKMGVAVDLIMPDGDRVKFVHQPPKAGQTGETYLPVRPDRYLEAVFSGDTWQVKTTNGWTYFFPYRPKALPQYVTVLTSFLDPAQRKYEMHRDPYGSLLDVTSASGNWLHFENDSEHVIRRITASSGRSVQYDYDGSAHMIRATPSDGPVDSYTYDDKGQMLSAAHGNEKPFLTNQYFIDGYIKAQTMRDGKGFAYSYSREGAVTHNTYITDPNGLETYVEFEPGGYLEWLPASRPH